MIIRILDGAHYLWWPSVLSGSKSVCTEKGSTKFKNLFYVILATPLILDILVIE